MISVKEDTVHRMTTTREFQPPSPEAIGMLVDVFVAEARLQAEIEAKAAPNPISDDIPDLEERTANDNAGTIYDDQAITDPEYFRLKAEILSPDEQKAEAELSKICWFPYRRINPFEKTRLFVKAYDTACTSMISRTTAIPERLKARIKHRGSFLHPDERLTPWLRVTDDGRYSVNPNWRHYEKARRIADMHGFIYTDYCFGIVIATLKRGWTAFPRPAHLHNQKLIGGPYPSDKFVDATVFAFQNSIYTGQPKVTDDAFFRADQFVNHPEQFAYYLYLAKELRRIHLGDQRAATAWRGYQKEGIIPAQLDYALTLRSDNRLT